LHTCLDIEEVAHQIIDSLYRDHGSSPCAACSLAHLSMGAAPRLYGGMPSPWRAHNKKGRCADSRVGKKHHKYGMYTVLLAGNLPRIWSFMQLHALPANLSWKCSEDSCIVSMAIGSQLKRCIVVRVVYHCDNIH